MVFSKLQGGYWPNVELVASKCSAIVKEDANGRDVSAFLAGQSPQKDGSFKASSIRRKKATAIKQTPSKQFDATGYSEDKFDASGFQNADEM